MNPIVYRIKSLFFRCIETLRQSPHVFICLVLLNLPYVIQHAFELLRNAGIPPIEYVRSVLSASLRTIFFAFLLDLLLKAMPLTKMRRFAQALALTASGILFLLDTFALWCYRCVLDKGMLAVLLATNPREASEYLRVYALQGQFALGLIGVLLLSTIIWFTLLRINKCKALLIAMLTASFACSLKFMLYLSQYSSLARYGTMTIECLSPRKIF